MFSFIDTIPPQRGIFELESWRHSVALVSRKEADTVSGAHG